MELTFDVGQTKWTSAGLHILDEKGIAEVYAEETTVVFDSVEIYNRVSALLAEAALIYAGSINEVPQP